MVPMGVEIHSLFGHLGFPFANSHGVDSVEWILEGLFVESGQICRQLKAAGS